MRPLTEREHAVADEIYAYVRELEQQGWPHDVLSDVLNRLIADDRGEAMPYSLDKFKAEFSRLTKQG